MAGGDSFGCCGLVQGLCGLVEALLLPPSRGFPTERPRHLRSSSSQVSGTRSPWNAGISSGTPVPREPRFYHQEYLSPSPVPRNPPPQQPDDDDDDDCVIVAEKGQVACRDFPHSRHLCSNMPFGTTSHEKYCTMCYCFVCDAPAPCSYWSRALSVDDHCHATDKETKWKLLRQAFKQRSNGRGTSNGHTAQTSHPLALTVGAPRAHPAAGAGRVTSNTHTAQNIHPLALTLTAPRASSATTVQSGASNAHTAQNSQPALTVSTQRASSATTVQSGTSNVRTDQNSHPPALTVSAQRASSATRVQNSTSNAHTAQNSHPPALTVSTQRAISATRVQSSTSNAHTAQNSHPPALTVSAQRASSATRVQSGTSNGHSAQVTRLVEPTVSAPRPHPEAGAGRGTGNAHTALITHSAEPTVSAARPYSAARTGTSTSNTHSSQITRPVEATVSATTAYPAGITGRGISNAHTAQITRPVEQSVSAPRVHPAARTGSDSSNARSGQITYPTTANSYLPEPDAPEGATVYVGNLPYHIDNERLKLSFQHAGVVLFSKVIYDRETGKSRGFGFVTMNTVQEAEAAVRMYHGSVMYGRPLTVKIAAPRGGARVDSTHRQSGSPLRIFVCNLPAQVDCSRLEELFSKHGKVVDARVIYERQGDASCSKGFGFVTMATDEESYNAIRALNKQVLDGHTLGVKVARERPERGSPSPSNQSPLQNDVSQNQNTHTSVRASLNVTPTVSVPRARSGTSVSAPRPREHTPSIPY
uniref:Uncharacterized protein n=1 Tax=Avena sativa TaxID=4498 RepID=A0ACD5U0E0_AVESA